MAIRSVAWALSICGSIHFLLVISHASRTREGVRLAVNRYTYSMQPARIIGNAFLVIYLYITACAFLFTVIRAPVFITFPKRAIAYSYGMTAPYQSAIAAHGQMIVECETSPNNWRVIDLAPFYPQMFGERNAREYFAAYAYSGKLDDSMVIRARYAETLTRLLVEQGITCTGMRLSWDRWPAMTGPFDALHLPLFTTRIPLYSSDVE
jgi:hypothetical protein